MALNLALRLGWAILISPEQAYVQQNFVLVLGSLELIRRCLWAVFRVEWEHICLSERRLRQQYVQIKQSEGAASNPAKAPLPP
jgi:hypothetical protein